MTSTSPPRRPSPGRSASVSPRRQLVDVRAVADKFWDGISPKPHLYLHNLSAAAAHKQFADNARPSLLQTKVKQRRNTLASIIQLPSETEHVSYAQGRLPEIHKSQIPETDVLQFSFSLVGARNVGPTGLPKQRQIHGHHARICMLDKAASRFMGNVWIMEASDVKPADAAWTFSAQDKCLVRFKPQPGPAGSPAKTPPDAADLSLFVELNVSHKLTLEDAAIMPDSERKASRMVDEVNTCWALINLQRCAELPREMEVAVPLYCGDLYSPASLDQLLQQERRKHPVKNFFRPLKPAVLVFRAGPLPAPTTLLLPYSLMPPVMVATLDWAVALAAYRAALALHTALHGKQPYSDPALAAFPRIMVDPLLLRHFMRRWTAAAAELQQPSQAKGGLCCNKTPAKPPTAEQVVALWRRLCTEVAPLLGAQALPPHHINNFQEYQAHRQEVINSYAQAKDPSGRITTKPRMPVEPLSHAAFEWLHRPFDVRETRFVAT